MNRKQELQALADKIASFTPLGGPISLIARERRMIENALRLAAQADAPAIQPQRIRETAAEAIRTFCKSLGNNVVVVSSDDVERIYYSGISVDALSAAIAIALTRPECGDAT